MEVIQSLADMTTWSQRMTASGKTIALVPTMGYFHVGHLSLMRLAAEKADKVVVSLFVNAMQFGPQEDLTRYPRDFNRDRQLAEEEGADVLFAPSAEDM
jgi:pantoate--beta-alanine ligase